MNTLLRVAGYPPLTITSSCQQKVGVSTIARLSQLTPVLGILARRGAGKRLKSQVSA